MEDMTCHECGGDLEKTLEVHEPYYVDTDTVCWSCRALAIGTRWDRHQHEKEKPGPAEPHYEDGRIYTVREMDPKEL